MKNSQILPRNLQVVNVFNIKQLNKLMYHPYKRNLAILIIWVIFGLIPFFIFLFTSQIDNSFYIEGAIGLGKDIIFLTYFIFIPSIVNLSIIYFPQISETLHSLIFVVNLSKSNLHSQKNEEKHLTLSVDKFNSILNSYEMKFLGKGKYFFIQILFIFGGITWVALGAKTHWYAIENYGMDIWSSQNYLTSFYTRTFYELIVFGFIFPIVLFKYFMIIHSMRHICIKFTKMQVIKLRPLNPDRAGGLGVLGKYSLKLVLFLIPPLFPIMGYIFFGNVNILFLVGLTLYIPFLIFTFFFPLSGAHGAMKTFKEQELRMLSEEFNNIYDKFISSIRNNNLPKITEEFELIEKIDDLYNKANRMPIWPFDTNTFTKFVSILGAIITSIWLNWLFGKLVQM